MNRRNFVLASPLVFASALTALAAPARKIIPASGSAAAVRIGICFLNTASAAEIARARMVLSALPRQANLATHAGRIAGEHREGATLPICGFAFAETEVALFVRSVDATQGFID